MKRLKSSIIMLIAISFTGLSFTLKNTEGDNRITQYKLTEADLPDGYKFTSKINCKSIQPATFYEQAESLYSMFIGEIEFKDFQSFKSKKDEGTILYFQFKDKCKAQGFIEGYLWGEKKKPSKQHPEEFTIIDNNILIIWSTDLNSPLKEIFKKKHNIENK